MCGPEALQMLVSCPSTSVARKFAVQRSSNKNTRSACAKCSLSLKAVAGLPGAALGVCSWPAATGMSAKEQQCKAKQVASCICVYVGDGISCGLGRQEHFYLEPNCSLVVPGEAGEVTIISSTQVRCSTGGRPTQVLNLALVLRSGVAEPYCQPWPYAGIYLYQTLT